MPSLINQFFFFFNRRMKGPCFKSDASSTIHEDCAVLQKIKKQSRFVHFAKFNMSVIYWNFSGVSNKYYEISYSHDCFPSILWAGKNKIEV